MLRGSYDIFYSDLVKLEFLAHTVLIFIEQFRARWPWSIGMLES